MDIRNLLCLMKECINSKSLKRGKLLHQKIICLGLQNDTSLCKSLINLYFSCHLYDSAAHVFGAIDRPFDVSLWNTLFAAYAKSFMFVEALELFKIMMVNPFVKPDNYTYPSVLKACGGLGRINNGKMLHAHLIKAGILSSDVVVTSSLVGVYAKCSLFNYAIQLFDETHERDVACWNTVITCFYHDGQCEKALEIFEEMKRAGFEPDSVTFTTVLSACARLLDLERGKMIHGELMRSDFLYDDFVCSALVDMYGKCGCLEMAKEVFERMPQKSVVSWNSMVAGYSLQGDSVSCIELFRRLILQGVKPTLTTLSSLLMACSRSADLRRGKFVHGYIVRNNVEPDIFIGTTLIDLYFKCCCVQSADRVFEKMPKTNVVVWNVMISGYVTLGHYLEAFELITEMRNVGVQPDAITLTSILTACSQLGTLGQGKEIHKSYIEGKLDSNEIVMGALLDMYAKCGAVNEAVSVFNQLPRKDYVSWTSMITAYGSHGKAIEALKLFDEMQKTNEKPDHVTFLSILSACSHAGLVDKGCYYFDLMLTKYSIVPNLQHYSCLIDLLGRAGRLREAYEILKRIPNVGEDFGLLSTLFSACHFHGDLELGEEIARLLIQKDPSDPSTYITLSNMYASDKNWKGVRKIRSMIKELKLRKNPACSWIEVEKRIQQFSVEDKLLPKVEMIYECLQFLSNHMEKDETFGD